MKLHKLTDLPEIKETEEEVEDLDFWDIFCVSDDIDDSDSKEETIGSCISMVSAFENLPNMKTEAKTEIDERLDEDIYYTFLQNQGMDRLDCDRVLNDERHGLTMGIPNTTRRTK